MPDEPADFDVFLSHDSRDRAVVQNLAARLKARGIRVWLDKDELRPGLPWQEGLEEGIEAARSVAVFVGRHDLGSWQDAEVRAFVARARRERIPVIPVLLPGCSESSRLAQLLRAFAGVDLRGGLGEEGLEELVRAIAGQRPGGGEPEPLPQLPGRSHSAPFLHHLPYPSLGPLFQGREGWLEVLHRSLAERPAGRATAIAGKAIHGLGGVGKTRLAVEYAWRYAGEYRAAFFVVAASPADLRRNLAALAGPALLGLPEAQAPEEEVRVLAVLRWLGAHSGWLLILDNVDSEEAAGAVDALLAQLQGGHVLLTGRTSRWGGEVQAFELDLLEPAAAVSFLLARTEGRRRPSSEDGARAAEIGRELGWLPLALEQAGAYIGERRLSLARYLEEWWTRREGVLGWFDPQVSRYPASVAVTWQTSVDRLSRPARRLLERLAWLGPEPIPELLLEVPVRSRSSAGRLLNLLPRWPGASGLGALQDLETYSLVTRAPEGPVFTVHRLLQDVTRRSLEGGRAREALAEALAWVDRAFAGDPGDVRTWPQLEPLAPHARAVVGFADQAGIAEPAGRLMNDLALLYDAKALLAEAEPLMRRALAIGEASYGPDHPKVARRLNNLAALLQATNRLAEAEPLMRRALAIDEASFGPDHPDVAIDLNNLATLLQDTNRLSEAEPLLRRAQAIDEASFGPAHPKVAIRLTNLAQLLQATNRLAEAEPLMRRALSIDEATYGPDHPKVAISLNNLAAWLQATNRLAEAEPLLRRALSIAESSYGPDHPDVAIDLNNLATLLQDTNRPSEAEPLMRGSLEILLAFTHGTGHEHPHLRAVFGNYSGLLAALGLPEDEIRSRLAELSGPEG